MSKSIFQSLGNEAFKGNCNPRVCLWVHYFDGDLPVHPQINLAEENLAKQRRPDSTKPPTLVGAVLDPEQAPSTSRHHGMSPSSAHIEMETGPRGHCGIASIKSTVAPPQRRCTWEPSLANPHPALQNACRKIAVHMLFSFRTNIKCRSRIPSSVKA